MHRLDVPRANARVFHNGDWSGDAKLVLDPDGREPLQFKIPAAVLLTLGKEAALAFARSALIYQVEDVEDVLRPADVVEMIEHIRWPEQVEGAISDRDIKPDNVPATPAVDPRDEELFSRYFAAELTNSSDNDAAYARAVAAVAQHRELFPLPPPEKLSADEPSLFGDAPVSAEVRWIRIRLLMALLAGPVDRDALCKQLLDVTCSFPSSRTGVCRKDRPRVERELSRLLQEASREQHAKEGRTTGGETDWHNVTKDGWPPGISPEVSTDAAKVAVMLDLNAAPVGSRSEEGVVHRLGATGHAEEIARAAINELVDAGFVAREANRLRRVQK